MTDPKFAPTPEEPDAHRYEFATVTRTAGVSASDGKTLAAAPEAPAVQPGWKLVPIEPTREMTEAATEQRIDHLHAPWMSVDESARRVWAAMLSAAPPLSPASAQSEDEWLKEAALSDEQINDIALRHAFFKYQGAGGPVLDFSVLRSFARAIEAHLRARPAPAAMRNVIFEAGWRVAAKWANRDDLYHDTTSAAYVRDRDLVLSTLDELIGAAATPTPQGATERDAARWRMLAAMQREFGIDFVCLSERIDSALSTAPAQPTGAKNICAQCNGLLPVGDYLKHCGPGMTTLCNCKPTDGAPPTDAAQPTGKTTDADGALASSSDQGEKA